MEMQRNGSDEAGVSAVYVHVRVGSETYALPVGDVQEVVPLGEPTPLPGAARSLLGLVTVHGRVIAVLLPACLEAHELLPLLDELDALVRQFGRQPVEGEGVGPT